MTEKDPPVGDGAEARAIGDVIDRLTERFPALERAHIEQIVNEEWQALETGRVRDFVPVLVEHEARERLRQEAAPAPLDAGAGSGLLPRDEPQELDPIEVERRSRETGLFLGSLDY